ncbi:MAG: acetyl-CoA carboxylase, carboxyltransferase subunit beta [Nitrospira sp.]|jgi:acetyl-CoA carboxylase carboxyl transferase subunit beta|uniref:acetyl-CoA carboxylase, carboxyltransferase subunit beta n=1 Tax=Nitrospira sp. ND1 TaxID=1658518 RepID=UPI0009B9BE4F|nr:acetyl-CoA carboxylase, carboxyltransferase subunit beta [Nitrospira sp. ND1]MBK7419729.1 acetyl-CoA carboxylase carboxyltransferase subunit beta [Nitrospira sp.]OYT24497.1 MAG: acetyl-CoA carboxylase carboxyl transferase subunit beta [Nitrospira sp. UW-LDO-02]MBK7486667.1 acetyl-CoA carboxylase carboxyltransferase subunit beta [Nitrospira sp.]MBK9111292.1 acetyl-CoA carboxylase carboxyltransferase subunit beta [Nitrospira sp.]MBK9999464.1 acetyl-CoA carboxylase carboxyltransferase subunit 
MAWFKKGKTEEAEPPKRSKVAEGMWLKCNHCREIVYRKEVDRNNKVCPKCDYHFPISVIERINLLVDLGTFKEWDAELEPQDPLQFQDTRTYKDRIKAQQEKTGRKDAMVIGQGAINGRKVALCVFDFGFMGGSMGSVVGEKICRAVDRALEGRMPLILVTASGGARMQEGILSLMQMAKTSAAVAKLGEAKVPFISILADPTFGGVTASIAMLGDVIIAEPKALIGFAGPRVIEQTIKQQLPDQFQRAEFLLDHGMIDMIVERKQLKEAVSTLVGHF